MYFSMPGFDCFSSLLIVLVSKYVMHMVVLAYNVSYYSVSSRGQCCIIFGKTLIQNPCWCNTKYVSRVSHYLEQSVGILHIWILEWVVLEWFKLMLKVETLHVLFMNFSESLLKYGGKCYNCSYIPFLRRKEIIFFLIKFGQILVILNISISLLKVERFFQNHKD